MGPEQIQKRLEISGLKITDMRCGVIEGIVHEPYSNDEYGLVLSLGNTSV